MLDEGCPTATSQQQHDLENKAAQLLSNLSSDVLHESSLDLLRTIHVAYLYAGLGELPSGYASLDASRPWIVYWIVHSLALLDSPLPAHTNADDIAGFLLLCQQPSGGFGGGPLQFAHLAPTYAAVCSLITLGTANALSVINRPALLDFLQRMCVGEAAGGGFRITEGGEADVRACYTAMAIAHMMQLPLKDLVTCSGMIGYLKRCQTYEGGLGGEPGNEAHGGYTFCGVAALMLADAVHVLDIPRLVHWLTARQGLVEGGFNGRTNKLVDGCYSFWQGGAFALLQRLAPEYLRQMPVPRPVVPAAVGQLPVPETPIHVPELPFALKVETPASQAATELRHKIEQRGRVGGVTARTSQLQKAEEETAAQSVFNAEHSAAVLCSPPTRLPVHPVPPSTAQDGGALPPPLCSSLALQLWVLKCCQQTKGGGLRDKPGKSPDFYHTCYCLSGLSSVQHASGQVLGPARNLLRKADALCNVVEDRLAAAREFYSKQAL